MLRGFDIIYFANDWNADNKTSSHHIVSLLGEHNRVLYVEAGGLRAPSGSGHDLMRIVRKVWRFLKGSRRVEGKKDFRVISLFLIPLHQYALVRAVNRVLTRVTVLFYMRRFKMKDCVLFFFFPHIYHLCGRLGERASVYYCIDDYASYPGVNADEIRNMDEALTRKADVTFAVSRQVLEKKKPLSPRLYYSPHGVDTKHFFPRDGMTVPPDIERLGKSRKIVLYWGLVAEWMDIDLVDYLARNQRDKHFVFLGRVSIPLDGVRENQNVSFLGQVDYADLPAYASASDVLIIPFKINDWTKNINPIKLKEYLATGKPVVSTAIPEALQWSNLICVASDKEEFARLVDASAGDSAEDRERRLAHVSGLTWEARVDEISSVIQDALQARRETG